MPVKCRRIAQFSCCCFSRACADTSVRLKHHQLRRWLTGAALVPPPMRLMGAGPGTHAALVPETSARPVAASCRCTRSATSVVPSRDISAAPRRPPPATASPLVLLTLTMLARRKVAGLGCRLACALPLACACCATWVCCAAVHAVRNVCLLAHQGWDHLRAADPGVQRRDHCLSTL
jgi:hypothetical protein